MKKNFNKVKEGYDILRNRLILFLIWGWGLAHNSPLPMDYGSGESPMDERVK